VSVSPLESMERDTIVQDLLDCGGSKGKAAESLGTSHATIYRKSHEYGIVTSDPSPALYARQGSGVTRLVGSDNAWQA
jgi:DNA-binding NtrC family response regulator